MRAENPFVFSPQWQQEPLSRIGAFVQREWFGTYDVPPISGEVTMSCDTAVKVTVRNDWSVAIVARYYQGRYYILDVIRRRLVFRELEQAVVDLCRLHGVDRLLIEDASSGQQLIQSLKEGTYPISAVADPGQRAARQNYEVRSTSQQNSVGHGRPPSHRAVGR